MVHSTAVLIIRPDVMLPNAYARVPDFIPRPSVPLPSVATYSSLFADPSAMDDEATSSRIVCRRSQVSSGRRITAHVLPIASVPGPELRSIRHSGWAVTREEEHALQLTEID